MTAGPLHETGRVVPQDPASSAPTGFSIESNAPITPRGCKPLTSSHFLRQPSDRPQRLLRLTMRCYTVSPLNRPHLDLSIQTPAQQIFSRVTPAQACNPCIMALEVRNLLARHVVVETNDSRITSSSQKLSTRTKSHGPDRLDEARKRVQKASSVVAEDIDIPTLVPTSSESSIRTLSFSSAHDPTVEGQNKIPDQHTSQNSPSCSSP